MGEALVTIGSGYLLIGLAVAAVFLTWGLGRIDPSAHGSWVFRPLLIPGIALIWPLVLWRWRVLETGSEDALARHRPPRTAQDRLLLVLACLIPVVIFSLLLIRQDGPLERPAVRLEEAG